MLKPAAAGGEVLLVAHTRLSLGYVLDHYRLLRHDPGLRFTLTRAPDQYPAGVEEMMDGAGLRRVPYCAAVRRAWDLALFGTHGSEIFFTAAARVHIQHGLGAGKLVDGQDYTYGPKWALWEGPRNTIACLRPATRCAVMRWPRARRWPGMSAWWATCGPTGSWPQAGTGTRTAGPARAGANRRTARRPGVRVLLTVHPHVWAGRHDRRASLAGCSRRGRGPD